MPSRAKQDQDPSMTTAQDTPVSESTTPEQSNSSSYETILVERRERVGLITLNRPKSLNALNARLSREVARCLLYTSPSPRDRTRSRMPSSA